MRGVGMSTGEVGNRMGNRMGNSERKSMCLYEGRG